MPQIESGHRFLNTPDTAAKQPHQEKALAFASAFSTISLICHADYESIQKLVSAVNPAEIIPIHTEAPEKMVFA